MVTKKRIAFVFPGQGAQYPQMALDLYKASRSVQDLFAVASEAAGIDLKALLENATAEELKRTDISQPTITLANLAAASVLREQGVEPIACAGFSLGEYAALACTGVVSYEDCFKLVTARGKAMQKVADRLASAEAGSAPGMAAVLGLPGEQVEALIAEWKQGGLPDLYAANFNSPKQVVVAGTASALDQAEERFKAAGARRVIRLQVAGPFHSPLVADALEDFAPVLEGTSFSNPTIPLFSNVTGKQVHSGMEAKKLALRQITEPVRWTSEEAQLAALGLDAVLETGPGKVLQGLWKDSGSAIPVYGAGTSADIQAFIAALQADTPQH
ncbi:ACP S-malonyltransferase [Gracilinema caldarium]|uniref:Malonyl CoA-acyl carrier protein transacylase n=1 Tax=Gracilinema caldarium (strain ATCC 51460 / DSM 7334 / H1) TaxID=744872 RepID=F8EZE0_GRAC1|nr:ACP S-malonyltransferase [Gracilinema caldarium]AEJ20163.1 (Acyl-carrier-protein) S-malonyltransferase [Gracilinema caldarium DSM 7334]